MPIKAVIILQALIRLGAVGEGKFQLRRLLKKALTFPHVNLEEGARRAAPDKQSPSLEHILLQCVPT